MTLAAKMYRCMLQSYLLQTAATIVKHVPGKRSAIQRTYSTILRNTAWKQSGITYSQRRYLKKAACMHGQIREHMSTCSSGQIQATPLSDGRQTPENVNGVLERFHEQLQNGSFKPESFVEFATALQSSVYSSLEWLPWLQRGNTVISFIQIFMNGKSRALLTDPLYNQKYFQSIRNHIEDKIDEVPPKDCPSILFFLRSSGMKQEDPLVTKLLNVCDKALPSLQMEHVRHLANFFKACHVRDFVLAEKFVSRFNEILCNHPGDIETCVSDLVLSSISLSRYMSTELMAKSVATTLFKLQEENSSLDIPTIAQLFRFAYTLQLFSVSEQQDKLKKLAKAALNEFTDFSQLRGFDIAELCYYAKRVRCYTGAVVSKLQERSLELLQDRNSNLNIRDITNLLSSFTQDVSPAMKQEFCKLLIEHLDDADVLTLADVADLMNELQIHDHDVVALFQWKVMQNIQSITSFISLFYRVERLLGSRQEHDPAFNRQIGEFFLRKMDQLHFYDLRFVVAVAHFMLPNVQVAVPTILMERLVNVIPRCSLQQMGLLGQSLEMYPKVPSSRQMHNQVLEIRSLLLMNVQEKIERTTSCSELVQIMKFLHKFRLVPLPSVMRHCPKLTKVMSHTDYTKIVTMFRKLRQCYSHPEVFEDLIVFAKNNYAQIGIPGVLDLVIILADSGYSPADFEDFSNFVVQVMGDAMKEEDFHDQIGLAYNLSIMQIFPDDILGQIFTFEYLEKYDSFIEGKPPKENLHMKKLMIMLNRSVVLECPHLDVPWFSEQAFWEQAQTDNHKEWQVERPFTFREEVAEILHGVMKGNVFVQQNICSPYFIPIDFQIVFNAAGEPVTSAKVRELEPDAPGYQRLAVMLVSFPQLCADSHKRRGPYLRDKRHLEILGYKVKEIPLYQWKSMALSRSSEKTKFLQSVIF